MLLLTHPVSSRLFTHVPKTKTLTTEISDLQQGFQQLYDDAVDVGLVLTNHKTGNMTAWYLNNTVYSEEGEVLAWLLKPTWDSRRRNKSIEGYTMMVVND